MCNQLSEGETERNEPALSLMIISEFVRFPWNGVFSFLFGRGGGLGEGGCLSAKRSIRLVPVKSPAV